VAQKELDHQLAASQFPAQAAQSFFIGIGWRADKQLLAELLRHTGFEAHDGALVDLLPALEAENLAQFIFGFLLHPNQQPAAPLLIALPAFHQAIDGAPAAQIEIANAEISPFRNFQRMLQSIQQALVDVVEDAWHVSRYNFHCVSLVQLLGTIISHPAGSVNGPEKYVAAPGTHKGCHYISRSKRLEM
jgi:hypothetical protein